MIHNDRTSMQNDELMRTLERECKEIDNIVQYNNELLQDYKVELRMAIMHKKKKKANKATNYNLLRNHFEDLSGSNWGSANKNDVIEFLKSEVSEGLELPGQNSECFNNENSDQSLFQYL